MWLFLPLLPSSKHSLSTAQIRTKCARGPRGSGNRWAVGRRVAPRRGCRRGAVALPPSWRGFGMLWNARRRASRRRNLLGAVPSIILQCHSCKSKATRVESSRASRVLLLITQTLIFYFEEIGFQVWNDETKSLLKSCLVSFEIEFFTFKILKIYLVTKKFWAKFFYNFYKTNYEY